MPLQENQRIDLTQSRQAGLAFIMVTFVTEIMSCASNPCSVSCSPISSTTEMEETQHEHP